MTFDFFVCKREERKYLDLIKAQIFFNTLILKWNHALVGLKKVSDRNKIHLLLNYEGNNLTIIDINYQNYFYQNFLNIFTKTTDVI